MRVLVYEDGLGNNTVCVYETDATNVMQYAIDAYEGKHADDIIFDRDYYDDYDIDFKNQTVCGEGGEPIAYDIAFEF
jgi:hypothetical protein